MLLGPRSSDMALELRKLRVARVDRQLGDSRDTVDSAAKNK